MTKLRPPLSPAGALATIAGIVGWPAIVAKVHRAESTVRGWSDPDTTQSVTFDHMLQLDTEFVEAGGTYRPFLSAFSGASDVADARRSADAAEIADAAAQAARESGQAMAAGFNLLRSDATDDDFALAEREEAEACEAHSRFLQVIRSIRGRRRRK
ncbi:hypothetical protein FHS31_000806 [Sphingomonas vulcanisoli]|uniref:Uncharacterized protein n=1 Tax=Sphingomonas vulcanisoli TaxID=1658060 RepID=A0ABX0TTW0_9SPHN|nr:hypothetical protein [Sphingomonas vulcanisoli]NIJ07210.1 hypothetical protein [Sphingomonas vulcanisoli]